MLFELSEILDFFAGGTLGLGKSSPLDSCVYDKQKLFYLTQLKREIHDSTSFLVFLFTELVGLSGVIEANTKLLPFLGA